MIGRVLRFVASLPARFLIGMVRFYQVTISPLKPGVCRFQPTCSAYSIEAIRKYGAIVGGLKTIWRVLRCQPCCKGGYDPP